MAAGGFSGGSAGFLQHRCWFIDFIGASLSEPHIYVISVSFVCLSVCLSVSLSVGPYVHNAIIYKCYSNLWKPLIIDCSFEQYVSQIVLYPYIQETLQDK